MMNSQEKYDGDSAPEPPDKTQETSLDVRHEKNYNAQL